MQPHRKLLIANTRGDKPTRSFSASGYASKSIQLDDGDRSGSHAHPTAKITKRVETDNGRQAIKTNRSKDPPRYSGKRVLNRKEALYTSPQAPVLADGDDVVRVPLQTVPQREEVIARVCRPHQSSSFSKHVDEESTRDASRQQERMIATTSDANWTCDSSTSTGRSDFSRTRDSAFRTSCDSRLGL
jgi:hypothetical protein